MALPETSKSAPPARLEVALADGNPLILSALSEFIDRDPRFSLVLTAKSGAGFLEALARAPVAVAIIDWELPGLNGQQVLEELRLRPGAPRVVVYAAGEEAELARRAMAAGAAGFCSRAQAPDRLLDTAAAVGAGQMVFPFVDVRDLQRDPLQALTGRERAMLAALARGRTNAELAEDLGISINTVKFHLRNLYDKLAIRNRSQAIAFYYAAQERKAEG